MGHKESVKSTVFLWQGSEGLVSLVEMNSILLSLWICLYCLFACFISGLPSNTYLYICQSSCARGI